MKGLMTNGEVGLSPKICRTVLTNRTDLLRVFLRTILRTSHRTVQDCSGKRACSPLRSRKGTLTKMCPLQQRDEPPLQPRDNSELKPVFVCDARGHGSLDIELRHRIPTPPQEFRNEGDEPPGVLLEACIGVHTPRAFSLTLRLKISPIWRPDVVQVGFSELRRAEILDSLRPSLILRKKRLGKPEPLAISLSHGQTVYSGGQTFIGVQSISLSQFSPSLAVKQDGNSGW